ncbi:TonB-dependent siderophore receptor [Methylosinus sp. LW4]|uniref:TonB-dependent siderophore receptor n=1 Tax=Methylosinus sp. LW4 TaxID=136993 RepID=UPI0003A4DC5F|nr:TonB-dependent receptor [Methylosinus sp. LW4]
MSSAVLAAAVGAAAVAAPAPSSPAQASVAPQDRLGVVRDYSIAPGTLGGALNEIADQSNVHVLYPAGATRGWRTDGLFGAYSLTEALDRLLAGTSLTYRFDANGKSVSIVLAQADNGVRSDAGAEALPPIDIGAERPASGDGKGGKGLTPENSYVTPVVSIGAKTDTPVMNTPVNVQAITQKALEDQQAINLTEALRNVSGVYVATGAANSGFSRDSGVFIRGFSSQQFYRDGFRIDRNGNIDTTGARQLGNVASIEVLKGPAAILYGLSEPGGIINVTTAEPQEKPHYSATQQIGSLALYRTNIGATGPLTPDKSVLYRLTASYENNGAPYGSIVDLVHGQNVFVAPVIKWNLDERTSIKAEMEYNNDVTNVFRPYALLYRGSFVTLPRNINYQENSPSHTESIFAALTLSHKFDNDWSIKQRVAYTGMDYGATFALPGAGVSGGANPTLTRGALVSQGSQAGFSTDLNLLGHFELLAMKHTLLLGGDFYRTSYDEYRPPVFWGASLISLAAPAHPGFPTATQAYAGQTYFSRQDSAGAYAQDQIELAYGFHLMAGARYQFVRQESVSRTLAVSVGVPFGSTSIVPSTEAERVTPRFGLLWRPQEWVSLYGNYTEGFAANGGIVYPDSKLSPPSNARSWEAGAKFEFFDGRLRLSADYYDLTKTNIPISDPDPTHVCGGAATGGCSIVVGEAHSAGPEVDIQGEILPGWNVIVTYTNQDVRVASGAQSGLRPGQRLPNVPRNLASLSTTYEFQETFLKGLKVGAYYTYHGSQPIGYKSGLYSIDPPLLASWGTVDLMAAYSWEIDGLKTKAQVNVTNLFDKTYYTDAYVNSKPPTGFTLASWRSYGAPFAVRGSLGFEF